MTDLIQFIHENQIIGLWLVREVHVCWPQIKLCAFKIAAIYPYCRDNGGVLRIGLNFFVGKPKPTQ